MDEISYEGLVRRLEAQAANNPLLFRGQVLLITSFAYLFLGSVFIVFFGFFYLMFTLEHAVSGWIYGLMIASLFTVLPAFYVIIKALFIRPGMPKGYVLTPKNAPVLFEVLNKIRKKLNGPPFHRVVIDDEFNAAISQLPKWGLFGGYKNHLIIGLPYLYGSTPHEMLATIAHEYGHVAGHHGKMSAWVYRQRITFSMLYHQLESSKDDTLMGWIIRTALEKFAPYFNAYTFVLSRQNEYEADRTATEIVGKLPNASGLIRGRLLGRWIHEEFWPKLYKQAAQHAEPLFRPYTSMQKAFNSSYEVWATPEKLQAEWRIESGLEDTHPCLSDRVMAIGEKPALPPAITVSAADKLLGSLARDIAKEFDDAWWAKEKSNWQGYHFRLTKAQSRIKELSQDSVDKLPLTHLHELAMLSVEFDSSDKAKALLYQLTARPGGPYGKAEFELGKILIQEKNPDGLSNLDLAARSDKNLIKDCAYIGYYFLLDYKGETAANNWWKKMAALVED